MILYFPERVIGTGFDRITHKADGIRGECSGLIGDDVRIGALVNNKSFFRTGDGGNNDQFIGPNDLDKNKSKQKYEFFEHSEIISSKVKKTIYI